MSHNGHPFNVSMSGALRQEVKKLAATASAMGIRAEFVSSIATIHKKHSTNPLDFGELRFHSGDKNFTCHIGAIQPVAVHFAVHAELEVVLILRVFLMGA
jgi:hypothetical protein